MSPVLTRPRPQSTPAQRRRDLVTVAAATLIGIAVLISITAALRGPEFIDRVTIVNDTPYLVDVEVTAYGHDGWLGLGPVSPGTRHSFQSVIDQGDRWVFHITSGPYDGGEFSVSKRRLEEGDWRVVIPDDARHRLEADGAEPPASR
jgi:hypothetical protein